MHGGFEQKTKVYIMDIGKNIQYIYIANHSHAVAKTQRAKKSVELARL